MGHLLGIALIRMAGLRQNRELRGDLVAEHHGLRIALICVVGLRLVVAADTTHRLTRDRIYSESP